MQIPRNDSYSNLFLRITCLIFFWITLPTTIQGGRCLPCKTDIMRGTVERIVDNTRRYDTDNTKSLFEKGMKLGHHN